MRIILKAILILLACLATADLVGMIAFALLGVAPLSAGRGALPLAAWFVLGMLCGFVAFGLTGAWVSPKGEGNWTARPDARTTANLIVGTGFGTLFALAVLFRAFYWGRGMAGEYFVPASPPHSMLFLASAALAMAVARVTLVAQRGRDG